MLRSQPTVLVRTPKQMMAAPPFPILESKLTPPFARPGIVPRTTVLDRLEASVARPVVTICAPAGYGKTVLAAQWAERDQRPFVWLSIDGRDNDPAVLLTYIAVGLDRVEPIAPGALDVLASRGASMAGAVVPRLGAALAAMALPVVVVLDDVHLLDDREGLDAIAVLVDHLPDGAQLVVTSRGEPPLPVARWRAEGRLAEFGLDDLAMSGPETRQLLEPPA